MNFTVPEFTSLPVILLGPLLKSCKEEIGDTRVSEVRRSEISCYLSILCISKDHHCCGEVITSSPLLFEVQEIIAILVSHRSCSPKLYMKTIYPQIQCKGMSAKFTSLLHRMTMGWIIATFMACKRLQMSGLLFSLVEKFVNQREDSLKICKGLILRYINSISTSLLSSLPFDFNTMLYSDKILVNLYHKSLIWTSLYNLCMCKHMSQ